MSQKITLFEGTDWQKNQSAESALNRLEDVELERVSDYGLLEDRVPLPFIETSEGDRYYGIRSIERFAQKAGHSK